jgi:hypothetical protein
MAHAGMLEIQSWSTSHWETLARWPPHECSRYGHCGAFGYCDHTASAPSCQCIAGFEPAKPEEWRGGRFAQGCRRKQELRCGHGEEDVFLAVPAMKAPDRFVVVRNKGAVECAAECAGNCSCVAYAHAARYPEQQPQRRHFEVSGLGGGPYRRREDRQRRRRRDAVSPGRLFGCHR